MVGSLLSALMLAVGAMQGDRVRGVSPDGRNEIRLTCSNDGLCVSVWRNGRLRVAPAPIGMSFDRGAIGETNGLRRMERMPDGVRAVFDGGYAVRLVATDEGVAYRFETEFGGRVKVLDETWRLPFASDLRETYFCYYCGRQKFDDQYQNGRSSTVERAAPDEIKGGHELIQAPFTARYADGGVLVASVADVRDYPFAIYERGDDGLRATFGRWPRREISTDGPARPAAGQRLRFRDIAAYEDYLVETDGTRTYPYHTYQLADSPKGLIGNRLVAALARPPEGDFSWVKPGKVAWDWWNAWHNCGETNCTTAAYVEYVDFAAENGLEYVILDEGWSEHLDIWRYNPAVDVPFLVDYAKRKGVGIILWMAWDQVVDDEERVVGHFADLGVVGFKVDFMQRCDAREVRFEEKFVRACAARRLVVDFHGQPIPGGLQRTYPNLLNYEGVHGLEQFKSYRGQDMPLQDVRLAFTRMCVGPLDYTPGAMDNYPIGAYRGTNANPGSLGTRAHQLALMTLYDSPLLMLCDAPAKYRSNPECLRFMAGVPTTWDETVGLGGDFDSYVALARRKGDVWYLSAVGDSRPRDIALATAFLGSGEWEAEIFGDAPESATHPTRFVRETRRMRAGETLRANLAPGGGFTVRFSRAPQSGDGVVKRVTIIADDDFNERVKATQPDRLYKLMKRQLTDTEPSRWSLVDGGECLVETVASPVWFADPFGEHAIVQRDRATAIWGRATAGASVTVSLGGVATKVTTGPDEWWLARLDTSALGEGPFELIATSFDGRAISHDVLVGEVWLAAGQSNMEFVMRGELGPIIGYDERERDCRGRPIRIFRETRRWNEKEIVWDAQGEWIVISPETLPRVSAVGYTFADAVQKRIGGPVAVVDISWSGTGCREWMPRALVDEFAELRAEKDDGIASRCWNNMVKPVANLTFRGILWYQGCNDAGQPQIDRTYPKWLSGLVGTWRREFGRGELPFLYCQVAGWGDVAAEPGQENGAALLREGQRRAKSLIPGSAMVVTLDASEHEVHGRFKGVVGDRLAAVALNRVYGCDGIVCDSPDFKRVEFGTDSALVRFDVGGSHLMAGPIATSYTRNATATEPIRIVRRSSATSPLEGFVLRDKEGRWHWADAEIVGLDTVRVKAVGVTNPTGVRYAWGSQGFGNLRNAADLPASPFTTEK